MNIKDNLIINGKELYIRKTNIGKFGICEIINDEAEELVKSYEGKGKIFIITKYKEWLYLQNKKKFVIESEGIIRNMWFCKILSLEKVLEITSLNISEIFYENKLENTLENTFSNTLGNTFSNTLENTLENTFSNTLENTFSNTLENTIDTVNIIYGRCNDSMKFLDNLYRDYITKYKFKNNDIIGIKSVAGSGKTTTLLNLAKIHKDKKILYIAFNKSLIVEIKDKIKAAGIKNLYPQTFDALMRNVYINKNKIDSDELGLFELKPQNLGLIIPWFANKPYRIKNYFVKNYIKFCNQIKYSDMNNFCLKTLGGEKKMLNAMWKKSLDHELITFDSIRKIAEVEKYCKNYLDNYYDMIFIDESQDFDGVMLKILLEDTTIPKLFVGDPKQAIYEWKGCINAFDKLPENALIIEFYSTFRVGNPACEEISGKFANCNMISKSLNNTVLEYNTIPEEGEKYVYLFRSWRNLLQNAQYLNKIWINNFESQINYMKRLHDRLKISDLDEDELGEFSDDLPKFLLKLSAEDLDKLINDIQKNVVPRIECLIEIYTIHTYKGLESNIVRIYNDIQLPKEENLYYVALTRGMKRIILDTVKDINFDKKQKKIINYGVDAIILK